MYTEVLQLCAVKFPYQIILGYNDEYSLPGRVTFCVCIDQRLYVD